MATGLAGEYFWPAYDGLTWWDREGKLQPNLAREWRAVDPKTWEFKLRDDVMFHDGTRLEAADVVGTFEFYRNPDNRQTANRLFLNVERVEAADNLTVRVITKEVDPVLPKRVGLALIMPWRKMEQIGMDAFLNAPVGTGPYRVVSYDFQNALKWEAMPPDFVSPRGPAATQTLEMRFIPEVAARMAALKTGEIDIAERLPPDAANVLRSEGIRVAVDPGSSTASFILDMFEGPTTDVRVRQAINLAVDRETILKTLLSGFGELDGQFLGKELLGYNPDIKPYPYDPDRARQLLADAGYPNGFETTIWANQNFNGGKELSEAVAAYLSQVGISASVTVVEAAVHSQGFFGPPEKRRGLYAQLWTWEPTYEPDSVWYPYSSDLTVENGRRWNDETFDQMFRAARSELDDQKRAEGYRAAGQYLHEQAVALFLWRFGRPAAMREHIKFEPGYFADMYTARLSLAS